MEIHKIKHFRTVVETGHMRKAADILKISAGALSKSLKSLSEELGKQLIMPLGRGICITDDGKRVYHRSHQLISQYDSFRNNLAADGDETNIRIGTFEVFSGVFMSEFLRQEAPDEKIQMLELTPSHIEEAIVSQEIDYGITYTPFPSPKLDHLKIKNFRMKIYALHPKKWAALPLAEWPFAVPTTKIGPNPLNIHSLDHWPEGLGRRKEKYKFELLQTALETTSRGLSVIYCPEFIARIFNRTRPASYHIKECQTPHAGKSVKNQNHCIFLVKRNNAVESVFFKKLAKFIRLTT